MLAIRQFGLWLDFWIISEKLSKEYDSFNTELVLPTSCLL